MRYKNISILSFLIITTSITFSFAQLNITGEVINVNRKHQIAFTDLTNEFIREGDIVEIKKSGKSITFAQVIESTAIMSKLGPVTRETGGRFTTNFRRISVGLSVDKVRDDTAAQENNLPRITNRTFEREPNVALSDVQRKQFEEENADLKNRIFILKESLRNVLNLIEEDINSHEGQ